MSPLTITLIFFSEKKTQTFSIKDNLSSSGQGLVPQVGNLLLTQELGTQTLFVLDSTHKQHDVA